MKLADKIQLAQWAMERVVPLVRAHGQYHPAGMQGPAHWHLQTDGLMMVHAVHVLLRPTDRSLSSTLDIWATPGPKVFTMSWEDDRPWQPPQVGRIVVGPWRQALELHVSR